MSAAGSPTAEAGPGTTVIGTLLLPPRPPPGRIARGRLTARVARGLEGRVVALVAGAGYGKTTLLVEALERSDLPWVWLSCDPRVATPEGLLTHVAAGLTRRFPGVATGIGGGPAEEEVIALANELIATVPDEMVIALDDVHALGEGPARATLLRLLEDLPPNVHFAVASRRSLGVLPSRVSASGVLVVDERELAFSLDEAEELLGGEDGAVDEAAVGEIHRRTEGWAAGLLLAGRTEIAAGRPPSGGPQFDYLAEEVLAGLDPPTRSFLVDTAGLERFTPGLAAAVTGVQSARDTIDALIGGHLFTVPLDDRGEWYRYHHLFHDFLRRRQAEERTPDEVRELDRRAAAALLEMEMFEDAVRHLLRAGDHEAAARALVPLAERTTATRANRALLALLEQIPAEAWEAHPRLRLASALMRFLAGQRDEGLAEWAIAIEQLVESGAHAEAVDALFVSQQAMLTCGLRPSVRIAAGAPYLPRLDEAGPRVALVEFQMGVAHAVAGELEPAEEWFAAAARRGGPRELALIAPTTELMRTLYFDLPAGRISSALGRIEPALERLRPIEVPESRMVQAYGLGFRAAILADIGRYEDCLRERGAVLEMSDTVGMRQAPQFVNLWWQLTCLSGMGDWRAFEGLVEDAERAIADGADTNVEYRYPAALARHAAAAGDARAALEWIALGREALGRYGPAYESPMVLCEMAHAAAAAERPDLQAELAAEARTIAAARGQVWYQARACQLGALADPGAPPDAALVREALTLSAGADMEMLWTHRERALAAPILAAGLDLDGPEAARAAALAVTCGGEVLTAALRGAESAEGRVLVADAVDERTDVEVAAVRLLTSDDRPAPAAAGERVRAMLEARPRPPIAVETFGGLTVRRGPRTLGDADYGRPKARALLAALVCGGRTGLTRDMLLDAFWPDLPPDRGVKAFDTTLHALRRALDPWSSPRSGASVIARQGDVYRLDLGPEDSLDVAEVERLAGDAQTVLDEPALARLTRAEEITAREFLPDFRYEDWTQVVRASLQRTRVRVLERLAEALLASGRPRAAIERYRRLVDLEPETERWHRELMRAYQAAGERGMALRQFHACRTALRASLGAEPSEETRALYRSLL